MRHLVTFSNEILPAIDEALGDARTVLDPFAGTGRSPRLDRHTTAARGNFPGMGGS